MARDSAIVHSCFEQQYNIMKYAFNSGGAFRNPTRDRDAAPALTGLA
jgi:hypothetical protein